jgi:thiol-disulfide isomerase/thioredoxin
MLLRESMMKFKLLAWGLTLSSFTGMACGQTKTEKPADPPKTTEKAEKTEKVEKTLKIGDAAPMFKGAKFLTGTEVSKYEPSKVYVVEFWATWCGPCIQAMPHLAEINAEYKDQGLVIVGLTTKGPDNSAEKVAEFVNTKGKKHGYAMAFSESEELYDSFMTASGQQGIPCSFVIDKAGKIAFIGHPMQLDHVVPKVLAGTWKGQADVEEIEKADKEYETIMKDSQKLPEETLKKLADFGKQYPIRAKQDQFIIQDLVVTMFAKKYDDAKVKSEAMIKNALEKKKGNTLGTISAIWATPQLNPDKKNYELVESAVEGLIKVEGETELNPLLHAAEIYDMIGKPDQAIVYIKKAEKIATKDDEKKYISELQKKIEAKKTPAKP